MARSPSLRQRALGALSRREYSRLELRRKLSAHAESDAQLDAILDELERDQLLSDQRFIQSLIHRRAGRYGVRRMEQELDRHGLDANLLADQLQRLKQTEISRCRAVWLKKFGTAPTDLRDRARQSRFLLGRGFDASSVATVLLLGDEHETALDDGDAML